jgi:hypothetical protein
LTGATIRPGVWLVSITLQGVDRICDFFEFERDSPRFVRRKHRVRAFKIEMHVVIKSKDRASGDKRDATMGYVRARRQ